MQKFSGILATGVVALGLVVAGCGGGEAPAKAPAGGAAGGATASAATLKLQDIKFDRNQLAATKGQMLTLTLVNEGALDHDFTIDKIDAKSTIDGKDAKTDKYAVHGVVKPKATGKLEFTPNEAGTFEFYCTVAGHKEAGMKGTLTIK